MSEQITALLNRYADEMAAGTVIPTPPVSTPEREKPSRLRKVGVPFGAAAAAAAVAFVATTVGSGSGTPTVIDVIAGGGPVPQQESDTPPPGFTLLEFPPDIAEADPEVPVPPGRERLRLALELPDAPVVEELTPYTIVIANPTDDPVSLKPCPGYRIEYGGQSSTGRLPCEQLPDQVAVGQTLRITLEAEFGMWDGPDADPARPIDVSWAIRGPDPAIGTTVLMYPPMPPPVATAPFTEAPAPPGEPLSGPEGLSRGLKPWWPMHPTIIDSDKQVRAGEEVAYTVRLWNNNPKDPVDLRPCRGFTQWLQRPVRQPGEQVAFLDWSFERGEVGSLLSSEHMLNCKALPSTLAARQWVQLEMRLRVPADYPPGEASLAWKVGELDVFGSPQTRYVTINVLPAN